MVERRKYKRYLMPRGTFVILRNELDPLRNHKRMSIGEIAMVLYKSKTEVMGQVKDMSFGGVAFDGNPGNMSAVGDVELDLLLTEQGIYLHNLPFSTMPLHSGDNRSRKVSDPDRAVFRFKKLSAKQKGQLRELLTHHNG